MDVQDSAIDQLCVVNLSISWWVLALLHHLLYFSQTSPVPLTQQPGQVLNSSVGFGQPPGTFLDCSRIASVLIWILCGFWLSLAIPINCHSINFWTRWWHWVSPALTYLGFPWKDFILDKPFCFFPLWTYLVSSPSFGLLDVTSLCRSGPLKARHLDIHHLGLSFADVESSNEHQSLSLWQGSDHSQNQDWALQKHKTVFHQHSIPRWTVLPLLNL